MWPLQCRLIKLVKPKRRQARPFVSYVCPNRWKVSARREVLSDGDSVLEVQHCVPPSARNKDSLAWLLDEFDTLPKALISVGAWHQHSA